MSTTTLSRSAEHRLLAGVCAGLADHLGVRTSWVRVAFVAMTLLGGAGALLYLWLWLFTSMGSDGQVAPMRANLTKPAGAPDTPSVSGGEQSVSPTDAQTTDVVLEIPDTPEDRARSAGAGAGATHTSRTAAAATGTTTRTGAGNTARWPIAELLLGACLLVAGVAMVLVQLGVQLPLEVLLPGLVVLAGLGLTWWQVADRERPDRNVLPRVLGALALVAVGVLMFFISVRQPSVLTVIGAAFAVLAGVALALAPWALRLNRELIAERAARAREAERSAIAAHLHDSVLQTLAAIQQRSAPGSEVARLARGQERDLREWLFRGADGASAQDQAAAGETLRQHAAALEAVHAVRFEVVTVGAVASVPEPIIAAAREAMLNAARHAGGDVTVYLEVGAQQVSVDVTDRGPGFDIETLPDGRMGVRESILGRMQRAGGEARLMPGPAGVGTSVRLTLPLLAPAQGDDPDQHAAEMRPVTPFDEQPADTVRPGEFFADSPVAQAHTAEEAHRD